MKSAASMFDESPEGVAFATRRGWREERAEAQSTLDPRTVTAAPPPVSSSSRQRELDPQRAAPDRRRGDAGHAVASCRSTPSPTTSGWSSCWDSPLFTREGSYGAVVDGRVAAISFLTANQEHGRAFNMFTATGARVPRPRTRARRQARLDALGRRARHHAARDHERRDERADARDQPPARLPAGGPPRRVSSRTGTASSRGRRGPVR